MAPTTPHAAAVARAAANQDRRELRAALTKERDGYLQRGLDDRADQVDEQLAALGPIEDEAPTPAEVFGDPGAGDVVSVPTGRPSVKTQEAQEAATGDAPASQPAEPAGAPQEPQQPPQESTTATSTGRASVKAQSAKAAKGADAAKADDTTSAAS